MRNAVNNDQNVKGTRNNIPLMIRSPSESTVYKPALTQQQGDEQIVDKISKFVENIRIQSGHNRVRASPQATQSRPPPDGIIDEDGQDSRGPVAASTPRRTTNHAERRSHGGSSKRNIANEFEDSGPSTSGLVSMHQATNIAAAREVTDKMFLEAEKYKAVLTVPKGMIPIDDKVKLLRNLDNDDDFFYVTCHVDNVLRAKIEAGEYVELEQLLPKDNSVGMGCTMNGDDNFMQLVN